MISVNQSLADELIIPFSCYPRLIQKKFYEHGIHLDLDGSERSETSWGYLKNNGAEYIIYTYRSATTHELNVVMKIVQEVEREMAKKEGRKANG